MSYFARKITISKWPLNENGDIPELENIPADAITSDLRTTGNTLSWWLVENNKDQAVLVAMAVAQSKEKFSTTRILMIPQEELTENFELENTEVETMITELKGCHYDMKNMDYEKIGKLGKLIYSRLKNNPEDIITIKKSDLPPDREF